MDKIAIISTRLGGIDGVSIEADKWAKAYSGLGLKPVYIAGDFGRKIPDSFKIEEMDYYNPEVRKLRSQAFERNSKNNHILRINIDKIKNIIKEKLLNILKINDIKYFSIENALSIPLNIPLGVALSEIIDEYKINTITRHHDFYWEREEFLNSSIHDLLDKYFPPENENIKHVVINTIAKESLYSKRKIKAFYIPNVFDFEITNKYARPPVNIKKVLGISENDFLFLQPTRIIERKRIERSIKLVEELSKLVDKEISLFVTGKPEKDEMDYFNKVIKIAKNKNVNLILSEDIKNKVVAGLKNDVFEVYNIYDAYFFSDLVTLPSDIEGFGNPVIEACAFRKPLFVNNYPVLQDILTRGFEFIVINKIVDGDSINKVKRILLDKNYREKVVDKNYEIARKFYSIDFLIKKLNKLLG